MKQHNCLDPSKMGKVSITKRTAVLWCKPARVLCSPLKPWKN